MNPTWSLLWPPSPLRRGLHVASVLVVLGGVIAGLYFALRPPPAAPVPEPPAVALDGVEKPVVDAIAEAQRQVRERPDSADAWGYLGKLLLTHYFLAQADQCFAEAEKLDEKQPRWPYYRGLAHLHRDNGVALIHLRRAAELGDRYDPGVVSIRLRLAETLLGEGETEEAEKQFWLVFKKDPNNPWLRYHRGVLALTHDDLAGAIDRLTPLVSHPSARQKVCAQLAMIYRRRKDEQKAATFAQLAAQLPPDAGWDDPYVDEYRSLHRDSQGRLFQLQAMESAGKLQQVVPLLKDINEDADSDLAHLALGVSLAKLKKYDEAERALQDTLARYPDKVQAHYFLAEVLFIQADQIAGRDGGIPEAARAKYRDAAEHARQAVKLKPDHGLAHLYLGRALLILDQRDEGLKELRQAVACKPEEAQTHFYLGEALAAGGQAEEGLHQLELAARLAGKDETLPVAATLRRVREKLGNPK
jgi:tetratricopeptide (TPR) repeat protein